MFICGMVIRCAGVVTPIFDFILNKYIVRLFISHMTVICLI